MAGGHRGERAQRLFDAYADRVDEAGTVLIEEACRMVDRLDKLDGILSGDVDVWCRLIHNLRTEDYELKIDSALAEARQQVTELRQLLGSLPLKESDDVSEDPDSWVTDMQAAFRDPARP